ncbi:MAG: hypothetical protein KKF56_04960 [Nanoarchaeota archaeon]|nr:hypothetical protein [Nanoarchaeota archaeon]
MIAGDRYRVQGELDEDALKESLDGRLNIAGDLRLCRIYDAYFCKSKNDFSGQFSVTKEGLETYVVINGKKTQIRKKLERVGGVKLVRED